MSEIKFKKSRPIPPAALLKLMMKMGVKPPARATISYPADWAELGPDEKYDFFKGLMLSTENRMFDSVDVARTYIRRTQRWLDTVELKAPDRVPNFLSAAGIIPEFAGLTQADTFYNGARLARASLKFQKEFNPEYGALSFGMSGRAYDLLGVNIMRWPGSSRPGGLQENTYFQYVEKEVMTENEYDQFINNPEGYLIRTFYPRIMDGLQGLEGLASLFTSTEPTMGAISLANIGTGPVRDAIENLFKAAKLQTEHMLPSLLATSKMSSKYGIPSLMGGFSKAPFDIIGDTLRGTKGIMMDLYRCPDKVLAACEAVTPIAIQMAVQGTMSAGIPVVMMPLHKGSDSFMSNEQFKKFYWPSFKKLLMGIIDAGLIPFSFVEGCYDKRLDIIADSGLPKGKTVWRFDKTDMKLAKEKLGSWACIGGNVASSLFVTSTPQQMEDHCKELIDICAPGGGYFLTPGSSIDQARPENVHAYINSTRKYGVY